MEPLTSFAINIAAGAALEIYKKINSGVLHEIKTAFNRALKDWSKNKTIRGRNENRFKIALKKYIQNPDGFKENEYSNKEITKFFNSFNNIIVEYPSAYNYLKDIKDEFRYNELKNKLTESRHVLSEILENTKFDPRDIEKWLNELPFDKGNDAVDGIIDKWYKSKKIDSNIKETLLLVTQNIYKKTCELELEIEYLKSTGNYKLSDLLQEIKKAVIERKPDELITIYKNYKEEENENKCNLLKELIKSSLSIVAYEQTKLFYKDLVNLNPTAENHFEFAFFLQEFNFNKDAINEYFEALRIFNELSIENPRIRMSSIALTLNNLGILHMACNKYSQAYIQYEEALEINRILAKDDPQLYLPDVAHTLNNFATLHSYNNELTQALIEYKEALEIRRELAKDDPSTYLYDVSVTLNNMGNLHLDRNEFAMAVDNYEEALMIKKELAKEKPKKYLPNIAATLNNLANSHSAQNEFLQAFENYKEALKFYRELSKENPRTYSPFIATILYNLANMHSDKHEYSEALIKYKEALNIRRMLAKEDPNIYLSDVSKTLNNLAIVYNAKNEHSQALEYYEEALIIKKDLAIENPQTYLPDVANTLNNLAILHSNKNEFPQAIEKHKEASNIYKKLAKENPQKYEIVYAQMLIMGVDMFNNDLDNLKEARRILEKYKNIHNVNRLLEIINKLEL